MEKKYLTVEEAARRYGIPGNLLQSLIEAGTIPAIEVDGRWAVLENDAALVSIKERLSGDSDEPVSISEAARRLDIHPWYIVRWISYGWVPVLGHGPRRAKMISFRRVRALAELQKTQSLKGRRLIPKGQEALILS
jgi:excisionase family DNA binding protein